MKLDPVLEKKDDEGGGLSEAESEEEEEQEQAPLPPPPPTTDGDDLKSWIASVVRKSGLDSPVQEIVKREQARYITSVLEEQHGRNADARRHALDLQHTRCGTALAEDLVKAQYLAMLASDNDTTTSRPSRAARSSAHGVERTRMMPGL